MAFTVQVVLSALLAVAGVKGQVLTPPYFNLVENRDVLATATCGEQDERPTRELYCSLGGANAYSPYRDPFNYFSYKNEQSEPSDSPFEELRLGTKERIVQGGQNCEWCDASQERLAHPANLLVDGSPRWWQSPPLSRGMEFNQVNITIHLEQEFHVAYVSIQMANSPRPGAWVLERSIDHGENWLPWQYFAESPAQCEQLFGPESLQPLLEDDSVICTTEYSKIVPLQNAQIFVRLLENRPSRKNFSHSETLQRFTRATSVRLRLLQTKTLRAHFMDLNRAKDPTITRRYFYSIKEVEMGGRCVCHGHAQTCDILDQTSKILFCRCEHNTCGDQCQKCCPGFEQKMWQPTREGGTFSCEPCNCFDHSGECEFDQNLDDNNLSLDIHGEYKGGGKCLNCQHNTKGINCDKCVHGYYRPEGKAKNLTDSCVLCQCDPFYHNGACAEDTGKCECNERFTLPNCDSCAPGYYDFPECKPCDCNFNGTAEQTCLLENGQCPCKSNFHGKVCDECAPGYFNFTELCKDCVCDSVGSVNNECNITSGQCPCKNNFGGVECNLCNHGYYNHPECTYCDCDPQGSELEICDKLSGQCLCKSGFTGDRCDKCNATYYNYPNCTECGCDLTGASSSECNLDTGACDCSANFTGRQCDRCSAGFFAYPKCLPCDCASFGSRGSTCDDNGFCFCKENFDGPKCDRCKENFYNYPTCEECNCDPQGVTYDFRGCDKVPPGELCTCKPRVTGRTCDQCKSGSWKLSKHNPEGCQDCDCFPPGTLSGLNLCSGVNGQCYCKSNVQGRTCNQCARGFFMLQETEHLGCTPCTCDVGGAYTSRCDEISGQCACKPRVRGLECNEPIEAHYFPDLWHLKHEAEGGRTPDMRPVRFAIDEEKFPNYSWKGFAVFSPIQDTVQMEVGVPKPNVYRVLLHYVNPTDVDLEVFVKISPIYVDSQDDVEQSLKLKLPPTKEPTTIPITAAGDVHPFVMDSGTWLMHFETKQRLFLDYIVLIPAAFYEATLLQDKPKHVCQLENNGESCILLQYPTLPSMKVVTVEPSQLIEPEADPESPLSVSGNVPISSPGPHVILVEYHSSEKEPNTLTIQLPDKKAEVKLNKCQQKSRCRVLATEDGQPAVFELVDDVAFNITSLSPLDPKDISVTFIPEDQWHLDYLKPASKCIQTNDKCEGQRYLAAPNSQVIEAEDGKNANKTITGEKLSFPVSDAHQTGVVALDSSQATVSIGGNVTNPGHNIFVVHYYNPKGPGNNIDVIVASGEHSKKDNYTMKWKATLPVEFCPSVSGCRAVIQSEDRTNQFFLQDTVLSTFIIPNPDNQHATVYLDSMTIVPFTSFSKDLLEPLSISRANEFLEKCSANQFHQDPSTISDYCKEKTFSLVTDFSAGAMECGCDSSGSTSFHCEKFGGQCPCKANVIGKQCTQCQSGYFGFPECQKCDCGGQRQCHPTTGQCLCPLHVTGVKCDACEKQAFGYDPLIGCKLCECHSQGSELGHGECDPTNGQCLCKNNVGGRQCDLCLPGFHSFPSCLRCACERAGTTADICDQETASCTCKENVLGQSCEACMGGTFNLQEDNPVGCTECFCFGTTKQCRSSNYAVKEINSVEGWSVTPDQSATVETSAANGGEVRISVTQTNSSLPTMPIFFVAPKEYLDHGVAAYGGEFTYSVSSIPIDDKQGMPAYPDIILKGHNLTLEFFSYEQPPDPREPFKITLKLTNSFFQMPDGSEVSRSQMMLVLNNLDAIHVKASYFNRIESAAIKDVLLKLSNPSMRSREPEDVSRSVEECMCPAPYAGSSCEQCADGYYRVSTGAYLGACVPCMCNGHSNMCDKTTGVCIECQFNTIGDHCEQCDVGFYGNATGGTQFDCSLCPCPHASLSNNFASSCNISAEGLLMSCTCELGYAGDRCETCDTGYHGDPLREGGSCSECDCNNNNDLTEDGSCDNRSGYCSQCMNNTTGYHCETCVAWYHGDAVEAKNCTECGCDQCGSHFCDVDSGVCECKPMIEGENCDKCQADTWGFDRCHGCESCNCAAGSLTSQCDLTTGQCACMKGVEGQLCDRCKHGYWNYGTQGCTKCDCESDLSMGTVCDVNTGQCQCQEGATGPRCHTCITDYLRVPIHGCLLCDECVHVLAQDFDWLGDRLETADETMGNVSVEALTGARLSRISDSVLDMEPKVDALVKAASENGLDNLEGSGKSILNKGQAYKIKADRASVDANKTVERAEDAVTQLENAAEECKLQSEFVNNVVNKLEQLAVGLGQGTNAAQNRGILAKGAQKYVDKMQNMTMEEPKIKSEQEKDAAEQLLDRVQEEVGTKAAEMNNKTEGLNNRTNDILDRIEDAKKNIGDVEENIRKINEISNQISSNPLIASVPNTDEEVKKTEENLKSGKEALNEANELIKNLDSASQDVQDNFDSVNSTSPKIDDREKNVEELMNTLNEHIPKLEQHVNKLQDDASILTSQFEGAKEKSKSALDAARVYEDIIKAINNATEAAELAKNNAKDAALVDEQQQETNTSVVASMDLLRLATEQSNQVVNNVSVALEQHNTDLNDINTDINNGKEALDAINRQMESLAEIKDNEDAQNAVNIAIEALEKVKGTDEFITEKQGQLDELRDSGKDGMNNAANTDRDMKSAGNQLKQVDELVPNVVDKLGELQLAAGNATAALNNVENKLESLRKKIAMARDVANRVGVGARFKAASSLTVQTPHKITTSAAFTKISLYFKTEKNDGLLVFFGNEVGTSGSRAVPSDDFLALEISGGNPRLVVDLGSGPLTLPINQFVSDGKWHKLTAERTGKVAQLELESEDEEIIGVNATIPGTKSVLNLHQTQSKLFVGGVPDSSRVPPSLRSRHFIGDIEDVKLHGRSIGLWNFALEGNIETFMAPQRNQLMSPVSETGISLESDGFVVMARNKWNPKKKATVEFQFKTYAKEGLLFYIGKERDFMAVELVDGRVSLKFDLGSGMAQIQSQKTYSDGNWHAVRASRKQQEGMLEVDSDGQLDGVSPGNMFELGMNDIYYVGGFPTVMSDQLQISSGSFHGCINMLKLDGESVNLNDKPRQSLSVEPGCSDAPVRLVAFNQDETEGSAIFKDRPIGSNLHVTLRFKTQNENGLLFDLTDQQNGDQVLMLSLKDNHLLLSSDVGEDNKINVDVELSSASDGHWHYVSAIKNDLELKLDVDDLYVKEEPLNIIQSGGDVIGQLVFGSSESSGVNKFIGCIADVTVQGELIDFAQAQLTQQGNAASLTGCPMEESVPEVQENNEESSSTSSTSPPTLPTSQVSEEATILMTSQASPEKDGTCSLPMNSMGEREDSTGHRFGMQSHSRLEYHKLPSTFDTDGALSLQFRATASNGLLIFATNPKHTDFYAIYMVDGNIVFSYDSGSGPAVIKSMTSYTDSQWHTVECKREGKRGWLYVDEMLEGEGESGGITETVDTRPPFYVGGLPPDKIPFADKVIGGSRSVFSGCIRNVQLDGEMLQDPEMQGGAVTCDVFTEAGMYFGDMGGYAVLNERFHVGITFSMELEVRPRVMNAVLVSVSTPDRDYLTLQIIEGRLRFSIDNGGGQIAVDQKTSVPPLCDGHWHLIKILKTKNLITLTVDSVSNMKFDSRGKTTATDTRDPLYIGGVPSGYLTRGLESNHPFVGCIRIINYGKQTIRKKKYVQVNTVRVDGDVNRDTCMVN